MVNLHRWLKRTSPHFVIAGSLVITGLSGCRSTQSGAATLESPMSAAPVSPAYPAPLMAPEAVPYTESTQASANEDREIVLEPPAPPVAGTGSSSATGKDSELSDVESGSDPFDRHTPPRVPLPEETPSKETALEETPSQELVNVEPTPAASNAPAAETAVSSDPFTESSLFPEDNPAVSVKNSGNDEAGTSVDEGSATPFISDFEPTIANQEVPVPNPGENSANVETPDVETPDVELEVNEPPQPPSDSEQELPEIDQPKGETSSLFPPPGDRVELPVIDPAGSEDVGPNFDREEAAQLPDITPSIVVENIQESTLVDLPLPAIGEPAKAQDQLASIAASDSPRGRDDSRKNRPVTRPLFPTGSTTLKARSEEVSVVAHVWSAAEDVVFDSAGNAYISHGKHISMVLPDGTVEPWATLSSPRGHIILPDGIHLVCDTGQRAIVELNADGEQVRKVVTRSDGSFLRAPGDLIADSNGGFYFTDPGYARIRNPIGRIHYVAADGSVSVVAQRLAFPEGIAFSADGSKLLVVESQAGQIVEFEILSPGEVGPKQVFASLSQSAADTAEGFPSGLVVDSKSGNVFVAHGEGLRVEVLSPQGQSLRSFEMGARANGLAFRESESNRVFVTGGSQTGDRNAGQLFEIQISN